MDRLQVCLWEEEKKKRNGGTKKDKIIEHLQSETDHLRALLKDERRRRRVERGIMKEWKAEILREPESQRAKEWEENQRKMQEINRLKQLQELLMVDLQLAHLECHLASIRERR
ncbi:stress response protein NST1-like isoform X2 [Salmo trutta]|uniref:stress response protein NST1-like isoform X2 n=1 Tax=Salmo trutta TaxID=8032 RepID=UPI00112FF83B|nr:stress response protein NST1-like isoform X2 [Salmo trutta]